MEPERYRVDDLARLAGTTVRNVRAYQDRGLLPPPEKVGRVGWYSGVHLARLRLIGEMLSRGYTLANIGELIDRWVQGQDLGDVLGLETALIAPWGEDRSARYSREELAERFAPLGSDHLGTALEAGLVQVEGDHFRVDDPRLLEGAAVLFGAGVPMSAVAELGTQITAAADHIAGVYVELITRYLVGDIADPLAPDQVRRLSDVVRRLRPLATEVVDSALAAALDRRIGTEVGQHLSLTGSSPEEPPASSGVVGAVPPRR